MSCHGWNLVGDFSSSTALPQNGGGRPLSMTFGGGSGLRGPKTEELHGHGRLGNFVGSAMRSEEEQT